MSTPRLSARIGLSLALAACLALGACGQRGPLVLPPKPQPGFVPPPVPASVKQREQEERERIEEEQKRRGDDRYKSG